MDEDDNGKLRLERVKQFGAMYMHNYDYKYPARPGFEPGTSRLQAPIDTNEPYNERLIIITYRATSVIYREYTVFDG